ncbi:uncharacterized protein LOC133745720 [Rosa rugosa]|uniref:uncharacterized protein LOC133745720 n=1 Tax=Rosa rugosa TaxID=74645 RepID=UPI002B40CEA1|nr:uncharacterized protein LOC133745720 [Rosa rugosa]
MEELRGAGHVCKFCGQSCVSGKVLGGHMRSHAFKNPIKSSRKHKKANMVFQDDGDGNVGYGLRLNPKRSWKFSGKEEEEEIVCKVCGKAFERKNALFGHMRHHSVKQRNEAQWCRDCGKGFESLKALSVHRRVHAKRLKGFDETERGLTQKLCIESLGLVRKKRSARFRYRIASPSSSFSGLNLSECKFGNGCGVDVEEAAFCLMMISRGLGNWGQISSVAESSNNNSFSVEVESPSQRKRVRDNEGGVFAWDGDSGSLQIKRAKVEVSADCVLDCENGSSVKEVSEFGEIDSGFVGDEMPKSGFVLYGIEELDVETSEEEVEVGLSGLGSMKFGLSKKAVLKACDSVNKGLYATESETFADSEKKREHKCRICRRVFGTHQALGGHQRVHKRSYKSLVLKNEDGEDRTQIGTLCETEDNCNPAKLESSDNSVEQEMETVTVGGSERKGHVCGICLKVFASGQALGGHKRSHYVKDSEIATDKTRVMKQQISDICDSFEVSHQLKLQEENDGVEFKPWWAGTEQKHELLVGLIPN